MPSSFEELFTLGYPAVVAYARRRDGPGIDAEDVAADVFRIAWERRHDIPEGSELPWLYGVARKVLANERRRTVRRGAFLRRVGPAPHAPPADAESDTDRALGALGRLAPKDQEVLRLAAWEGLTGAGLGLALGCSANAATVRLHRARSRFRSRLAEADAPIGAAHHTRVAAAPSPILSPSPHHFEVLPDV